VRKDARRKNKYNLRIKSAFVKLERFGKAMK
jgi:hypothetical protein